MIDRVYDVAGSVTCSRRDLLLRIHSALIYDTRRRAGSPRELLFGAIARMEKKKQRNGEGESRSHSALRESQVRHFR